MIDVKDRVPTKPGRMKLTREDGSVEYVIMERADEPVEGGTPINKALFDEVVRKKKLIAEFNIAGIYNWEIPNEIKNIGVIDVFIMGAGGSGGACNINTSVNGGALATGGTSGYIRSLKDYDITGKNTIQIVIGAGGESISTTSKKEGQTGGSSSFDGNVAYGGAGGSGKTASTSSPSLTGATMGGSSSGTAEFDYDNYTSIIEDSEYGNPNQPNIAYNPNSLNELYGSAGSSVGIYSRGDGVPIEGKTYETASGSGGKTNGASATGYGNGGAGGVSIGGTATSGNGSDGIVLIYA